MVGQDYIDIHTHNFTTCSNVTEVITLNLKKIPEVLPSYFTLGIHPWEISTISWDCFEKIFSCYGDKTFALGEIGLDKTKANFEKQKELFQRSLHFAHENKLSRLIIHNVQSTQEITQALKSTQPKAKVLFHDYNYPIDVFESFSRFADCYISTGKKLFTNAKILKVLKLLPKNKIFLETDDQKDYPIDEIYQAASSILNMGLDETIELFRENFCQFASNEC